MNNSSKTFRPISFLPVYLGLLFFANPYFGALDLLPDFLGCALILCGISRASRFSGIMSEAKDRFIKLFVLDLIKLIVLLAVMGSSANADRPTLYLIVAFVCALLHVWLSCSALRSLYDGFYALAMKTDTQALYESVPKRHLFFKNRAARSRTERVLQSAYIFVILRECICLLPEFSALSTTVLETGANHVNMYQYIGIMRLLAFMIVLIASIFYIISVSRYFLVVKKQKSFAEKLLCLEQGYFSSNPGNKTERRYATVFLFFSIGAFFMTDFYLDFTNVIPDILGAICFAVGVLYTDLSKKQKIVCTVGAGVYGLLATLSSYFARDFAMHFSVGDIDKTAEGARAYLLLWGSALLEFFAFLAFLVLLLLLLRTVIFKWAGYLPKHDDLEFEQRRRIAFLEEYDSRLIKIFIWGFFSGLFSFIYDYMQIIPGGKWFRFLEFFWAYDFCLGLIFACLFSALLAEIHKQIKNRFSLSL